VETRLPHAQEAIQDYWTKYLRQNLQERRVNSKTNILKHTQQLRKHQIANFTTAFSSSNLYIHCTVNNIDLIVTFKRKKKK